MMTVCDHVNDAHGAPQVLLCLRQRLISDDATVVSHALTLLDLIMKNSTPEIQTEVCNDPCFQAVSFIATQSQSQHLRQQATTAITQWAQVCEVGESTAFVQVFSQLQSTGVIADALTLKPSETKQEAVSSSSAAQTVMDSVCSTHRSMQAYQRETKVTERFIMYIRREMMTRESANIAKQQQWLKTVQELVTRISATIVEITEETLLFQLIDVLEQLHVITAQLTCSIERLRLEAPPFETTTPDILGEFLVGGDGSAAARESGPTDPPLPHPSRPPSLPMSLELPSIPPSLSGNSVSNSAVTVINSPNDESSQASSV